MKPARPRAAKAPKPAAKPRRRPVVTPRKQPTQERAQATVEAILQATAYILVRSGYAKLTTNRIAERAGVNIASLYQYFPNKDAIVAELQRRHVAGSRARAAEIMAQQQGSSLRATIRALVASGVAAHGVEPELHRVFEDEMPRIRGSARGASVDEDPTLGARQAFMAASRYQWDDEERVSWVVRTAAHAVIHRAVSERPDDLASGALTEELVTLIEKYLLARRRK